MHWRFELANVGDHGACFVCSAADVEARIGALGPGLFRVLLKREGAHLPNGYAVARGAEDIPFGGVEREGEEAWHFEGEGMPLAVEDAPERTVLTQGSIRITVEKAGFLLCWEMLIDGVWRVLLQDRRTGSYNFGGTLGRGIFHYVDAPGDELIFGLGEKAGSVVRNHGYYRMKNVDCMGYDAEWSDPLYKHIPYYMARGTYGCCGIYYDTAAECSFDLGREKDNYHAPYRCFHSEGNFLDYYVLPGRQMADVVPEFSRLGGATAFPPRWTLGYLASSMGYTDSDNAQERLLEFLDRCRAEEMLISGFHLSSGYTSIDGRRYVFHWNEEKFPDVEGLSAQYRAAGVHFIANIKPCLLEDHPQYSACREEGLFITGADGTPAVSPFWGAEGSCLDFTNRAAFDWWKSKVKEQLLERGIAATWNDNNEFEVWDDGARCDWNGEGIPAVLVRPILTLLMLKASREAQREYAPHERPYLITRSGCLGLQRYAQTWTGDNYTDWKTLRYNHKMGLGLSLSGIYNFGHDVGGFAGPKPDSELFVRWVQHGIFMPRFSIHSWNDDGTENEPWMYPEHTGTVQQLISFRYTLIPYLYNLLYRASAAYEPVVRPVFYEFDGGEDWESDLYCLGGALLVANVFDPGVAFLSVSLPKPCGWYELGNGTYYEGGETAQVSARLEEAVPVFVRAGSVLPLNTAAQGFKSKEDCRLLYRIFLPREGGFEAEIFRDDGHSEAYREGGYELTRFQVDCLPDEVNIRITNATDTWFQQEIAVAVTDMEHRPVRLTAEGYTVRKEEAPC